MTHEYRTENGEVTTADDPQRLLWYGCCTYWTDDWGKVRNMNTTGIPCCPHCKSPGFQITADKWFSGAKKFQESGHSGYVEFLSGTKEQCRGRGVTFMDWYSDWLRKQPEAT